MAETISYISLAILVIILLSVISLLNLKLKLECVDRKLNAVLKHLNIEMNPGLDAEIAELASSGKKIEAIMRYRQTTGASLRDAKNFVEGL